MFVMVGFHYNVPVLGSVDHDCFLKYVVLWSRLSFRFLHAEMSIVLGTCFFGRR